MTKKHFKKTALAHTRYYNKAGKQVKGVTTILNELSKPALYSWHNRMGLKGIDTSKYMNESAAIGTLAHEMIQEYLSCNAKYHYKGAIIEKHETDYTLYTPAQIQLAENCLLSFYGWLDNHPLQVIALEKPMVSEIFQYGGTIDCYCKIDNKYVLLDFKTGSGIYEDMAYQLAAYAQLLLEDGNPVDWSMVLNIPRTKTDSFKTEKYNKLEYEFVIFKNALEISRIKELKKRDYNG
ncbi:MAG: PD-(D/E)XK nuclease family protein [Candidatus Scalindua sp.]